MINKIYKSVLITGASSGIGLETLKRFLKEDSIKHFPAKGDATLSGVIVDCNIETGLATGIQSYIFGGQLNKN